jgi:hypothetical protein
MEEAMQHHAVRRNKNENEINITIIDEFVGGGAKSAMASEYGRGQTMLLPTIPVADVTPETKMVRVSSHFKSTSQEFLRKDKVLF